MDSRTPSPTAGRVAGYRLQFDRLAVPYGDPAGDDRLGRDVAGDARLGAGVGAGVSRDQGMTRYLRFRTAFFDRAVVNALERHTPQVVVIGAGYDGRAVRYAKPGVRWWEVDLPPTQDDKRGRLAKLGIDASNITFVTHDLRRGRLGVALWTGGLDPSAPCLILCEGVATYLDLPVIESLLRDLRSVATTGSRLAISWGVEASGFEGAARKADFRERVAGLGEPVRNSLTATGAGELMARTRWRPVPLSERSQRIGLVVAAPE
jgi:methyltransferase (TIGR00027 family)